jgi:integrase
MSWSMPQTKETRLRWEPGLVHRQTPHTRPVDFHGWRRAYSQALANAGASAQEAQALAGHASLDAHARYLNNTATMALVPVTALPAIQVLPQLVAKLEKKAKGTKEKSPALPRPFR